MQEILDAILDDASGPELAELPLPETFRAATVHKEDVELFAGLLSEEKDPQKSSISMRSRSQSWPPTRRSSR